MKTKVLILLISLFLLVQCHNSGNQRLSEVQSTTLKLNWVLTGSYAPDALAAKQFAPKNKLKILIQPGGQGLDPLKLVKENEFGIASADEIIRADEKGANFVIIGVINNDSPACFISLAKDSIRTPQDFIGKTVGILPFGSTGLIYRILLRKVGIEPSKIKELTISPDLKMFISGKIYQVQPAFIYDETVTLDMEGISYNVIEPKDYGVSFKGPCYFTSGKTIENNPELVQRFINTMAEGITNAIINPEISIDALKELDQNINKERELMVWKKGIPYYKGLDNKPLYSNIDGWNDMITEMKELKEIKYDPDLTKTFNFTFINNHYNKQFDSN